MLDLKVIIEKYPRSVGTRSQLASLLRDLYPSEKRAVNVALAVYDSGIATRIAGMKSVDSVQLHSFIKQLVDEFGLQEQFATEGIEVWAKAYELTIVKNLEGASQQSVPTPKSITHNPDAYAKVGEIVTGSASDYELTSTDNGVVISKFRGFDEADVVIPNTINGKRVVGIGENAYLSCSSMQTLVISDGIEFVENGAFAKCENLKKVILPETLERIGSTEKTSTGYSFYLNRTPDGAFEYTAIQNIVLPSRLTYIGKSTFASCRELVSIDIPNGVSELKENTFSGCSKLTKVVLPECLLSIGASTFSNCSNLKDIQFPVSLKEIGRTAFSHCSALTEIILNEGLVKIGAEAFTNCTSLTRFLMPSTVTEIADDRYSYGKDLFTITSWYQPYDRRRKGYSTNSKNENLTIYCYSGSYGLEYAREKKYPIQNAANLSK